MCVCVCVSFCSYLRAKQRAPLTPLVLARRNTQRFSSLYESREKNHTQTLNPHRSQTFFVRLCRLCIFSKKPTRRLDDDDDGDPRRKKRRIFLILISKNLPQRADDGGAGAGAHFLLRSSRLLRAPLSRSFLFRARRSAFIRGRERRLKK